MAEIVLRILAAGGQPGAKLADVIQRLVVKAAELGELESYQYLGAGGQFVTGKQFPTRWLNRLNVAIEKGAIDHLSIDRIVDIMLQGPR